MKSWYESKTIWLGVATIATAVVSAVFGGAGWQEAVLAAIGGSPKKPPSRTSRATPAGRGSAKAPSRLVP